MSTLLKKTGLFLSLEIWDSQPLLVSLRHSNSVSRTVVTAAWKRHWPADSNEDSAGIQAWHHESLVSCSAEPRASKCLPLRAPVPAQESILLLRFIILLHNDLFSYSYSKTVCSS